MAINQELQKKVNKVQAIIEAFNKAQTLSAKYCDLYINETNKKLKKKYDKLSIEFGDFADRILINHGR